MLILLTMDNPTGSDVSINDSSQSVVSSLTETSSITTGTSTSIKKKRGKGGIGEWRKRGKKSSSQHPSPEGRPQRRREQSNTLIDSSASENSHTQRRLLIALMYRQLGAPPVREWNGPSGTILTIIQSCKFKYSARKTVHRVLVHTQLCMAWGIPYTGATMTTRGSPQHIIKDGSYEQKMVANFIG